MITVETERYLAYRNHLRTRLHESGVPEHIHEGLMEYLALRRRPGHFLIAVLSNDLREACGRADHTNRHRLFEIVSFLYNHAPAPSWGSPERVKEWLEATDAPPMVVFD